MKLSPLIPARFAAVILAMAPWIAYPKDEKALQFANDCATRLSDSRVLRGDAESWFFPASEIRQLSLGEFWDKPWNQISRNRSNPIPSMLEFDQLLGAKGVELLVVPIPAKASIYPEKFSSRFEPGEAPSLSPFLEILRQSGLKVLDLEPVFLSERRHGSSEKLWCAQDAHFSPMACVKIAKLIAETLEKEFSVPRKQKSGIQRSQPRSISIRGDLVAHSAWEKNTEKEFLPAQFVGNPGPLQSDVNSPVLLLGDSHTLVFSDRESFHCEGAGLFDHLSAEMGRALDLEGNAGSGLVTSRMSLFRKAVAHPGYWQKKRAVVWVFTAREFTQSSDKRGFISIPIERE